jgi:enoyl-CoA hydratase/carnithine racemase
MAPRSTRRSSSPRRSRRTRRSPFRPPKDAVLEASYHAGQAAAWARQLEHNEAVLRSRDSREGVAAFLAKRPPAWTGE